MRISYFTSKIFYYVGILIILLVVGFGVVPLLTQLGKVTPSFADDLRAEIWGILFTVVFIILVLDLREYFQWRPVETEVYASIESNLTSISDSVFSFVKGGLKTKTSILGIKDWKSRREAYLSELSKLRDSKEIAVEDVLVDLLLEDKELSEHFTEPAQRLSNIEGKYSRFFSSQLTISLMRIQDEVRLLKSIVDMNLLVRKLPEKSRERAGQGVSKVVVKGVFKGIIEELFKIYETEIEPYYV